MYTIIYWEMVLDVFVTFPIDSLSGLMYYDPRF